MGTWGQFNCVEELEGRDVVNPIVVLGSGNGKTFWYFVSVEASIDMTAVVFLRSRQSLGLLPELNYDAVPAEFSERLRERMHVLLHDIRAASDVSIIDSSREAMTCLLAAKLHQDGKETEKKDLGVLVKIMEENRLG